MLILPCVSPAAEHQDLELADDRDDGRLMGDHAVERGKAWLGDRTRDMRGGAVWREVLGERDVHGLGVAVEEYLDHRDADRAAIEARQVDKRAAFRAELRIQRTERGLLAGRRCSVRSPVMIPRGFDRNGDLS
jgi:hypothetical protein